jgi:hypothetical protein
MDSIKAFLDHFYFSLVAVAAGLVVVYLVLSVLVVDFSVSDHKLAAACVWLGVSALVAAILTYRTVRSRRKPSIPYTRRET